MTLVFLFALLQLIYLAKCKSNLLYHFPDNHIVGGQLAAPGQFPYQAGLFLTDREMATKKCGGSIIHKRWILTAAHCTDNKVSATVFLGTTDLSMSQPGDKRIAVRNTNDIITHPNYQRSGLFNDIGLIRLPEDIVFSDRIQPIRMALSSSASYQKQAVVASGYGRIRDDTRTNQLWWTTLRVMTNDNCRNYYGNIITNEKLCTYTGPPPHSTCQGDSGGPLVLNRNNMLIAVTSFVSSSCEGSAPAGFQRVNVHKRWIETTTGLSFN